jgi:hypothetical protein
VNEEKKLALGQNMIFRAILGNQLNVKKEAAVRASSNQIRYEAKNDDDDDDDDTDDDDDDEEHDD